MDPTSQPLLAGLRGEGWQLRQSKRAPDRQATDDTLFALANGSLGVRGGGEECADGDGCFLAGAFERHAIHYHERFPGFARSTDTRVPVADGRRIRILLDGAPLDLDACEWLHFERVLDLRTGRLQGRLRVRIPTGEVLQIDSDRIVADDRDLLAIRYRVASETWQGRLTLESSLASGHRAAAQGDDPRIGTTGGDALPTHASHADETGAVLLQATRHSGIAIHCAQAHRLQDGLRFAGARADTAIASQCFDAMMAPGDMVALEKFVAYATTPPDEPDRDVSMVADAILAQALDAGFDALAQQRSATLDAFWQQANVEIDGDEESAFALRFNLFHLLQSANRTPDWGTAAKGLTGEGYEGHCFWDTEAFVLPVMALTAPRIARAMLLYRHRTLDAARENARALDHPHGALFAWRTIAGRECSGHYPTGSAAYHINAAVAWAIGVYMDATGDFDFLRDAGAEMLFETARIWPQVGHFDALRGGGFGIHGVTGPDEYSVLVDNNFHTNRMAQRHLRRAAQVWDALGDHDSAALAALASRLDLSPNEVDAWRHIADAMLLPIDPALDIYAQDDTFLHKPRWPFPLEDSKGPLLLRNHPLTLYRHQVSKQADLVMALMLAGDGLDPARKRRSFDHYEAVTTHDSTLSAAVHGIVASEVGLPHVAKRYFEAALRTDLDDLHGNTAHGVHMAAMAGSWLGLAMGFAGLRIIDGDLHFAPTLPDGWRRYRFGLQWRGCALEVEVDEAGARYALSAGDALDLFDRGRRLRITRDASVGAPFKPAISFPLACRALVFDLDGVLTDTAHLHYLAWKRLAEEIGVPFDEADNHRLKGVSRAASLDILLERAARDFGADEKNALMERKNAYYRESIALMGPEDLFTGVRELLSDARWAGLKLALASASRNAPELLAKLGIADAFDVVVDAGTVSRQKPDPEIFLAAAAALGMPASACIGIEDAAAGVAAIKAAGMAAIGIGDARELALADRVLPTIDALRLADIATSANQEAA